MSFSRERSVRRKEILTILTLSLIHIWLIEAERQKTEAELKNLKNQLNPHFLLNTLNNIYALIAFNSDKAQAVSYTHLDVYKRQL